MKVLWFGFLLIFPLISFNCTQKGQEGGFDSATFESDFEGQEEADLGQGLDADALGVETGNEAQVEGVSVGPASPSDPVFNAQPVSNIQLVHVKPTLSPDCNTAAVVEGSNEFRGKIMANDFTVCRVNFSTERNRVCVVSGSQEAFGVVTTWEAVDYMEIRKIGNEPIIGTLIQYICVPMDSQEPEEGGDDS